MRKSEVQEMARMLGTELIENQEVRFRRKWLIVLKIELTVRIGEFDIDQQRSKRAKELKGRRRDCCRH